MHGPDGRHITDPGAGATGGGSILSHHDLKITDTRQPGPGGEGAVVRSCQVTSVIHRKGDPKAVVHTEENVFEPENGVYGSHMSYEEPGEYVLVERIAMPDGTRHGLSFPIWVPAPDGDAPESLAPAAIVGGVAGVLLLIGAFLLGRRSGRRAAAALLAGFLAPSLARAGGEGPGHMHGPDGRHITLPGAAGGGLAALRAYPTADRQAFAVQTRGPYRFRLSIENEEMGPPDPDLVALSAAARAAIDLQVAVAREEGGAGGLVTTGQVRPNPNLSVTVVAPVGGRIARVGVTPGGRVAAGHVVAEIDSPEVVDAQAALRSRRAEQLQAEAARRRAQAQVRLRRAEVAEAEAATERLAAEASAAERSAAHKEAQRERQRQLAAAGAFAQGPLEAARLALSEAESELAQAEEALAFQETQVRRLEQGAIEGVVARRDVEAAQTAAVQARARL
jgi:hypothetical protein